VLYCARQVSLFELWHAHEYLHHRVEIASISKIYHSSVVCAEDRDQHFTLLEYFRKCQTQIRFEVQLRNSLFSFLLTSDIYAELCQVVSQVFIVYLIIARIAVNTCSTLGRDGALLDDYVVAELFTVLNTVLIAATTIVELAAAAHMTARQTQPHIALQVALAAFAQR